MGLDHIPKSVTGKTQLLELWFAELIELEPEQVRDLLAQVRARLLVIEAVANELET